MSRIVIEKPQAPELSIRLWNLQLEMIDCLLEFCKVNGVILWAGYGTLLGCVRHKGFIPWDDDVDFVMFREEYDRLRELIKAGVTLPEPYHFDLDRDDVVKLRCDGTSFIMPQYKLDTRINQNVWVDIFCLDALPNIVDFERDYRYIRRIMKMIANKRFISFSSLHSIPSKLKHLFCVLYFMINNERKCVDEVNTILRNNLIDNNENIANIIEDCRWDRNRHLKDLKYYNKHWFDETVYISFEDIRLPCPKCFDEVLKAEYGDYMIPVYGGADHSSPIIDLDNSYEVLIENKLKVIPWYKRVLYKI